MNQDNLEPQLGRDEEDAVIYDTVPDATFTEV